MSSDESEKFNQQYDPHQVLPFQIVQPPPTTAPKVPLHVVCTGATRHASHWSDGTTGCRNQRAPRIGEIQRHKAVELEHSPTSSSSNSSSTNSSTSKSPTAASPTTTNPFIPSRTSSDNSANISDPSKDCSEEVINVDVDVDAGTNDTKRMADGSLKETPMLRKDVSEAGSAQELVGNGATQAKEVGFKVKNVKVGFAMEPEVTRNKEKGIQRAPTKGDPLKSPCASDEAKTKAATSTTNKNVHPSNASVTTSTLHLLTNSSNIISSLPSLPHPPVPPLSHPDPRRTLCKRSSLLPKTKSLDLARNSREEVDPDELVDPSDEDDSDSKDSADRFAAVCRQTTVIQRPQNRLLMNAQSQEEISVSNAPAAVTSRPFIVKGVFPKMQSADSRSTSPRTPLSPGGSPLGSPRSNRRRTPLKESRRISIEQSGDAVQVNQYKLMEEIGKGAYGLVKLAYNKDDSTLYAMKMLSKSRLVKKAGLIGRGPKKAPSLTPLQRVYKEIAVLKKLNHPNVVKLVEVLDDPTEDCLYLAFELEQQGDVLRIPTERPLSEERAWSVFRDSLQGLEYLHYQRVIHSDIKPGNLLLGDDGHVKIADLGVCTEFVDEDATMDNKSPAGTPAFRAPETLLEGVHSYNGKAADIWSLGATLYALVYGNVPFVGLTVPVVYEKIKNENLKFPSFPAISDDLRDLISRMLVKDPAQRITTPQIKVHKWVTADGKYPLPTEEENCRLVELETEDLNSVCRSVPKLFDTFVLIKAMLKNHSFQNPFSRSPSGRAPQRGGSRLERFVTAGRSKSAPGDYDIDSRHLSSDNLLPVVKESVQSSYSDLLEQSTEDPI